MAEIFVTPVSSALLPVDILKFASITGVANSIETTVLTYTATGNVTVGDIVISGTDYARFNIYINTVLSFVVRTGPLRQGNLTLNRPLQFVTSDIIDVKVIHYHVGVNADFEATILGI